MPPPKECNPHFVYGTASNENKVIQLMIDLFLMRGKVGLYCYAPFGPDGPEKKVWTKKMSQVFTDTNEVFVEFGDKTHFPSLGGHSWRPVGNCCSIRSCQCKDGLKGGGCR